MAIPVEPDQGYCISQRAPPVREVRQRDDDGFGGQIEPRKRVEDVAIRSARESAGLHELASVNKAVEAHPI